MIKRLNKRGQFYLIAAIIIAAILMGFITMSNYSTKWESISVQDMGEELKIESEKVLDFGTYNAYSQNQMKDLMGNFSENYTNYVRNDKDSYFLYGDSSQITIAGYSQSDKIIKADAGAGQVLLSMKGGKITFHDINPASAKIILIIDETDYEFELKSGENFYFILFEESGGQKYVAKN
jgi:hypothetical protein